MPEVNEHPAQPALMPNRIIRIKDVMAKTGLSRSHIYALCASGVLPRKISIVPGGSAVGWIESEIDEFLHDRIQARG
jgi:prophage regulatory protein